MVRRVAAAAAVVVMVSGVGVCAGGGGGQPDLFVGPEAPAGGEVAFTVETVATGLEAPWGMEFLPDGRMLVTERPGRVRMVRAEGGVFPEPVFEVPGVATAAGGEIGLMDVALHPFFGHNSLVYLAFGHTDGGTTDVRVVRYRMVNRLALPTGAPPETLVEDRVIISGIPAAANHAGCRMAFGPDGKLYITTGEATRRELAQDLGSLGGKTLRLNDDGTVPCDNPFVGVEGARPEVFSLGHRNPQGIAFDPVSGLMFVSEHGPSGFDGPGGGDEINVVEAGRNYGWPVIHHGMRAAGLESPIVEWTPAIAPAGVAFYDGAAFPGLRGELLVAGLRGSGLWRVELGRTRRNALAARKFVEGFGRIRDVKVGPDGAVYLATSNRDGRGQVRAGDDKILRLAPVGP